MEAIVYGFGDNTSHAIYNLIEDLLNKNCDLDEDDYEEEDDIACRVGDYLEEYGIDYYNYDYSSEEIICIGCRLPEGPAAGFLESYSRAKSDLERFDKKHGTNFSKNAYVFCDSGSEF